ncbi:retrovirus-related Pol polyprotein from transposon 17.6 [Nephila pilipes]|uniref:Retrovirus-related Pol polyprotein from transposon 17.6 n=1 Tax=Nephila pilipes TaxID=299642 RepID=A0A8X6MNT6_NEPPI|nr:retrovirus-related Pol polyprotein from transposon 17.6 [Nephila pilipes]
MLFIDHHPLIYDSHQNSNKASPLQLRHLDFVLHFTSDIHYISGKDNVIADTISRIEEIQVPETLDFVKIVQEQTNDDVLKKLISSNTNLQYEKFLESNGNALVYNPACNGFVERWHRTMKTAITCHSNMPNTQWTRELPTVLLGLRSIYSEEFKGTPAKCIYGTNIRLPGDFLQTFPNST